MSIYKYAQFLNPGTSSEFDKFHSPGDFTPYSGIYRCEVCGFECVSVEGKPLPPARTCGEHDSRWRCGWGQVKWRLIVYAVHTNDR